MLTKRWREGVRGVPGYRGARVEKASDKDAVIAQVEAIASKLEPGLAKAILAAFQNQQDDISVEALAEAIKTGNVQKVLAILNIEDLATKMAGVEHALQSAVWSTGAAVAVDAMRVTGVTFAFNQLSPHLVTWLQTYSLDLIRQINEKTREGVREYLVSGMKEGSNPIAVAREIKGIVGLTNRQAKAVQNYRAQLETFHMKRTAGGFNLGGKISRRNGRQVYALDEDGGPADGINERRLRDFRFDGQLKSAMENGKPLTPAQIEKMVAAYERKYLKYRAETIARTEALRTTNMGIQEAWRQQIETGKVPQQLVRRMWIVARDERTCEICAPIPSMNPKRGVGFAAPFATPIGPLFLPTAHPNCRCVVFIRRWEPSQLGLGGS